MEKEFIKETKHSVTLNVTAGRIDSYREIERTTGTVRVYDKGFIGVAGCLGEPDEEELTKKAVEALAFGIPYPEALEGALEMEVRNDEEIIPIPEFIPRMQSFLDRLGALCPEFAFSNKISLTHNVTEYLNSKGRRLASSGREFSIGLIAQRRGSGNLFDTFFGWSGASFDEEALLDEFKKEYEAFFTPVEIEPGRYPVVMEPSTLFETVMRHFIGDLYVAGTSLVSGRLGEKIFSDKLTVKDDMDPATAHGVCFFDAEGCVAADKRPAIIENGVLSGLLTTKKTAAAYGLPNIGTATAAYDGVPDLGFHGFYIEPTAKSRKELLPGKAVFAMVASGGDTTPDGRFATPVQMAYLMEDGELVGRLPDISISGNFFDLLGKDYLGSVRHELDDNTILTAVNMEVSRA